MYHNQLLLTRGLYTLGQTLYHILTYNSNYFNSYIISVLTVTGVEKLVYYSTLRFSTPVTKETES